VAGRVRLTAPALLEYEVLSGLSKAVLGLGPFGRRLSRQDALEILETFQGLGIELFPVENMRIEILELSIRESCSAYDAAYLALAARGGWDLATADERLVRGVGGRLPWVKRLTDAAQELQAGI